MKTLKNGKIPVIVIAGPTASGKTAVSVEIAKRFNAEVISADSMQIYKGMDIASAKPTADEMQGIEHHLVDFLEPHIKYSVAKFCEDAFYCVEAIRSRNKNVIVAGGTGLYIDSFVNNIVFEKQEDNEKIREKIRLRREKEGIEAIYEELRKIDPETADSLHINNEGRVMRAYETYLLTGEKPSVIRQRSRSSQSPFAPVYICLMYEDREKLYDRINKRVDIMLEKGLLKEAEEYFSLDRQSTSSQAIGHKELIPYLTGEISLETAVENLKRSTRNYAKRQLTWFRRNENMIPVYCDKYDNFSDMVNAISDIIKKSGLFEEGDIY